METINGSMNSTQLIGAINANQGDGIQEILATDNATELIRKLNENFAVSGQGGSGVFPANTILPSDIGSLEQGEDIGGMTIDDFIAYGINGNPRKLTFLHMSDPHRETGTINDAKALMDEDTNIQFLIVTGDMNCNVGESLSNAMLSVGSKMLAVVGNHDLTDNAKYNAITARANMETWIGNNVTFGNQENYGSYWHKDYPLGKGKLRVIGLDQYNYPLNSSPSVYANCITQAQVDWFISLLKGLSGDDYFIVALHEPPFTSSTNPTPQNYRTCNKFSSSRHYDWAVRSSDGTFFPAIIDAYTGKKAISKGHEDISVFAEAVDDFSGCYPARFLGYVLGHIHSDYIGAHVLYPNQLLMTVDCAKSFSTGFPSDIRQSDDIITYSPRTNDILYNKVTIDVLNETIHIERIGQKVTCEHTVDSANWNGDANDPHGDGYKYPSVTRDEITFDFDAKEVTND